MVSPTHVYIRAYQPYRPRNLGRYGYGGAFGGRGRFGFGFGAAAAVAIAAIIAFAVIPFAFFW